MLGSLLLVACTGEAPPIPGVRTEDYFPTDGERLAEYVNAGTDWLLVMEKVEPVETIGNVQVTTFEWTREDTGELLGGVKWAHDDGIQIHGWAQGTGAYTMFDPPLVVAEREVHPGDAVETTAHGYTFTSTYVGMEDCPVAWGMAWEDCLHFSIDDGDGDPMAGPLFAGDYWLVQRYGIAWMKTTGYADKWDLRHHSWEAD